MRIGTVGLGVLLLIVCMMSFAGGENGRAATVDHNIHFPLVLNQYPQPDQPYVLHTIALPNGSHPHGIALDTEGNRAFVGNHHGSSLSVVDTWFDKVVGTVVLPGADGPNGVAYHAGTDRVYVANRNSANVSVVDPTTMQFVQNIPVGVLPNGVVVQDDWVYVANWGSNSVTVIDAITQTVYATLSVGPQPALFAGNDDRGFVYLSSYGSSTIYFLKDGAYFNSRPNVPFPYGAAFDPITFRLYAASRSVNQLTMVDVNPNRVVGHIDTGAEVFVSGINPRSGHLFAVMGDRVQVYDRRDNAWLAKIDVGSGSEEGIAVDAGRHLVYVTAGDSDNIAVIQDIPTYDIAYVTWLQDVGHVRIMDDDGEHGRILSGPDLAFSYPDWDPAGKHLAFSGYPYTRGEYDIFRIEAGGQNYINLSSDGVGTLDERPLWSPDGSQIAWLRDDALWLMDNNGANKSQLSAAGMIVHDLDWSPDGSWIVIAGRDPGETADDIYLVPAAGGSLIQLTTDPADDSSPHFAPDGTAVVFDSNRSGSGDIYLLDISDLGNVQTVPLTTDTATDHSPVFSHDGTRIAFISYQDCTGPCLFVMDADGSNPRNLTGDGVDLLTPLRWSPDDRWLATHTLGGATSSQVIKVNSSSGEIVWLTNGISLHLWPTWRPDTWK